MKNKNIANIIESIIIVIVVFVCFILIKTTVDDFNTRNEDYHLAQEYYENEQYFECLETLEVYPDQNAVSEIKQLRKFAIDAIEKKAKSCKEGGNIELAYEILERLNEYR